MSWTGITLAASGGSGGGGDTIIDAGGPINIPFLCSGAAVTDTNQIAAKREFLGFQNRRQPANLAGRSTIRAYCSGVDPGGAGSKFIVEYSLDNGLSSQPFVPACEVLFDAIGTAVGTVIGTEVAIPAEAQGNVLLMLYTDGDAVATDDPSFNLIGCVAS